ncbi:MAG: hypothetical protein EAX96_17175 [Candidatus Lokiarchaeota archaeon]|nr:hypothetical protein [Candidatus Lokiarchaeota archaeon]
MTSINAFIIRFETILNGTAEFLPLFEYRTQVYSIPFLLASAAVLIKFSSFESSLSSALSSALGILTYILSFFPEVAVLTPILGAIITFEILTISAIISISALYHSSIHAEGSMIAYYAYVWPTPGYIWCEARGPNEEYVFGVPISDVFGSLTVYCILDNAYWSNPVVRNWQSYGLPVGEATATGTPIGTSLNSGSARSITFDVKNTGVTQATYSFEIPGLPSTYYSLPSPITLDPDQAISITMDLHLPSTAPTQPLPYRVNVIYNGKITTSVSSVLHVTDSVAPNFELADATILDNQIFNYFVDINTTEGATNLVAQLYFQGNVVGSDSSPTISSISNGQRYIFEFVKPLVLGNYTI